VEPEQWRRVERIFNAALELEPNARKSFLDQACGNDSWLRRKVSALFVSHEQAASFLESPASLEVEGESRIPAAQRLVGQYLGPYELTAHLASGGMGDVYRARDTKLRRDVAIKILPTEFRRDPDRAARFQREAVALAALNHPNIAAIYDLEEIDGVRFLVLEYVEGETLAARLKKGPLPVHRAVEICRQIAEGLEAAHAKAVHHRDLKPDNIQITPDDGVKLLDFGLAKVFMQEADRASSLSSLTQWNTNPGVIMGTAAYLSPEQARGLQPDKRSDIWAFGCVLFESLTGRQAFSGETITDVFAAILKTEPDWSLLPKELPAGLERLIRLCLQKQPKDRLHDIADARIALKDVLEDGPATVAATRPTKRKSAALWVAIFLAVILGAGIVAAVTWKLTVLYVAAREPVSTGDLKGLQFPDPTTRFSITLPQDQQLTRTLMAAIAISPDGSKLAYVSQDQLLLRGMSGTESYLVSGTKGALNPEFSPDGQALVFWSYPHRALEKVDLKGSPPIRLSPANIPPSSLSWNGDAIAYAGAQGIIGVPVVGGSPEVLVHREPGEILNNPQLLDSGRLVLFSATTATGLDRWDKADIVLFSRQTGKRKIVMRGGSDARYVPSGHLVYVAANTLFAVPFDLRREAVTGSSVPVIDGVLHTVWPISAGAIEAPSRNNWPFGVAQFDFSANGTLIYVPRDTDSRNSTAPIREIRVVLKWFDELKRRPYGNSARQ